MKKRSLKNLKLNKETISGFNSKKIQGGREQGISILMGCDSISTCPFTLIACTRALCEPNDEIANQ